MQNDEWKIMVTDEGKLVINDKRGMAKNDERWSLMKNGEEGWMMGWCMTRMMNHKEWLGKTNDKEG